MGRELHHEARVQCQHHRAVEVAVRSPARGDEAIHAVEVAEPIAGQPRRLVGRLRNIEAG